MGFSTRRGRPPKPPADRVDPGTPELRFKQAHGLTAEPVDWCLERQIITPAQHRSALHLRWLYTIRYGAPSLTTRYDIAQQNVTRPPDDPGWRQQREHEYNAAILLLQKQRHYEPVMRVAVYNEWPHFLHPALRERAWQDAGIANHLANAQQQLCDGLQLLSAHWKYR